MPGVQHADVRIAYDAMGDRRNPALLLCSALGTDRSMWDDVVDALAEHFLVLRYDLRGHGGSTLSGAFRVDELVDDACAVLDAAAVKTASVCGAALGALVALMLAARHPQRVERLVLTNASSRAGSPAGWDDRVALVRSAGMGAMAARIIPKFFTAEFARRSPDVVRRFTATIEAMDPEGYVSACSALREADGGAAAARVSAPTLVVSGSADTLCPPEDGRALHRAIAGSRFVLLDAAHLAPVEQSDAFLGVAVPFLRGLTGR